MNQTDFGKAVGVTLSAEQKWELGISVPSDAAIMNIASKFGYREEWLRTGDGEPKADGDRAEEVKARVEKLFRHKNAEFQQALISTLLQFEPDGPQWRVVEEIFESVRAKMPAAPVPDPNAPADLDSTDAQHAELDRLAALEKGDTDKSEASLSTG
jgi:transcriptional regulator with XRE-family HTH domain